MTFKTITQTDEACPTTMFSFIRAKAESFPNIDTTTDLTPDYAGLFLLEERVSICVHDIVLFIVCNLNFNPLPI